MTPETRTPMQLPPVVTASGTAALIIQETDGPVARIAAERLVQALGLQAIGSGVATVMQAGAIGNGLADDSAAFLAGDAAGPMIVPPGTYRLASNVTLNRLLIVMPGALIVPASGTQMMANGPLISGIYPIFDLGAGGAAHLSPLSTKTGYPEWWGAQANNYAHDSDAAFLACLQSCAEMDLQNDDYYFAATFPVSISRRRIRGVRGRAFARGQGTRLVVKSATAATMLLGTEVAPGGGINAFVADVTIEGVTLTRDRAPVMDSAFTPSGPTGLRVRHVLTCQVRDIFSSQHAIGYYYGGVVASQIEDARAFRSVDGAGSQDWAVGHFFDGSVAFGAAGGNASIELLRGTAEFGGTMADQSKDTIGLAADGAFVDSFIEKFESTRTRRGMVFSGTGPSGGWSTSIDVKIIRPTIDQCYERGIEIASLAPGSVVQVERPFVAFTDSTNGLAGIHVHDGAGKVIIDGGETHCKIAVDAGSDPVGLLGAAQSGLIVGNHVVTESMRPVELVGCSDFEICAEVVNNSITATQAAINIATSSDGRVLSAVTGKAGAFPAGVELMVAGNARLEVNVTRVAAGAITGGAASKLRHNGASVPAAGSFGTDCIAAGVIAA